MGTILSRYCSETNVQLGYLVILHLGVVDFPYAKGGTSTGDVATFLEDKFGIMQKFADMNEGFIAKAIENGLAGELEDMMMGKPAGDPFLSAMAETEDKFREYITLEEHGIVTKQRLMGTEKVGARFKKQYRKAKGSKTTFVESGNYRKSFKAWIDDGEGK